MRSENLKLKIVKRIDFLRAYEKKASKKRQKIFEEKESLH